MKRALIFKLLMLSSTGLVTTSDRCLRHPLSQLAHWTALYLSWSSITIIVGKSRLLAGALLHGTSDAKVAACMQWTPCCPAVARRHVASSADSQAAAVLAHQSTPGHVIVLLNLVELLPVCLAGFLWSDQPCWVCAGRFLLCAHVGATCPSFLKLQPCLHNLQQW